MRRLWLVRHGESTWNALGLVQGQARGAKLSPLGRRQAVDCARALGRETVGALYASDLERAVETAEVVGKVLGMPVAIDERLRERSLGGAEGAPIDELAPDHSGVLDGRVVDPDASPPGGESVRELYARVVPCVEEIVAGQQAGDLVVVSHGGVVRVVLAWLDGQSPDAMAWPEIENGSPIARSLAD